MISDTKAPIDVGVSNYLNIDYRSTDICGYLYISTVRIWQYPGINVHG